MPNYCENDLIIHAKGEALEKVKSLLFADGKFTYGALMPMPKELEKTNSPNHIVSDEEFDARVSSGLPPQEDITGRDGQVFATKYWFTQGMIDELIEKYGAANWYDWRYKNWGVKWDVDADESSVMVEEESIKIYFSSPWGPPEGWFNSLCNHLHNDPVSVTLQYVELGMGFAGKFEFDFGELSHTEGTIANVIEGSETEVTYDSQNDCWVTDEGQPVHDDDVVHTVLY